MIADPKLIQSEADPMLSPCNNGGRSRDRTADPLGVNDTTHNDFNELMFVPPVKVSGTHGEQAAQSDPFLIHSLYSPDAAAYVRRWQGIRATVKDPALIAAMWDAPKERAIRQQFHGQLSRSNHV